MCTYAYACHTDFSRDVEILCGNWIWYAACFSTILYVSYSQSPHAPHTRTTPPLFGPHPPPCLPLPSPSDMGDVCCTHLWSRCLDHVDDSALFPPLSDSTAQGISTLLLHSHIRCHAHDVYSGMCLIKMATPILMY